MIKTNLNNLLHLFYPNTCVGCSKNLSFDNDLICIYCQHDLPHAYFTNQKNNLLEQVFFGKTNIKCATSLLLYESEGIVKKLIHELKYKRNQKIGVLFGELLANELKNSKRFQNLDCIIPVPLHPTKLKKRGYNQLSKFGDTLAKKLEIPFLENLLIKKNSTETQTKKNKYARLKNTEHSFEFAESFSLENKNILLIDDVITTGATLEACAKELSKKQHMDISIATIAYASKF